MDPRLILFDVDGTLIDTAGAGRRAMERACLEVLGIDGIDTRASGVRYAGMTDPIILRAVVSALGVQAEVLDARGAEIERSYLRSLAAEMGRPDPRRRVLPGVRGLLEALSAMENVFLGLITGNFEAGARVKLEPFGLNPYFPDGGFASDHPDRREIARRARGKLATLTGVDFGADQVVVVGDTEHDVDCARANGYRAVAVDSGWVPREELRRAGPDALLDGLDDRRRALEALGFDQLS